MEFIKDTYVINLDKSVERLAVFKKHANNLGIHFTRWSATNGFGLSKQERTSVSGNLCKFLGCAPGVIGCYLSHIRLLKHIINTNNDPQNLPAKSWYLIFEDDAYIHPNFINSLKTLFNNELSASNDNNVWSSNPFPHMIQLGRFSKFIPHRHVSPNLAKVLFANGTTCYIINLQGAKRIVQEIGNRVLYHIDVSISFHDIALYTALGDFLLPHNHLDSTISSRSFPRITSAAFSLLNTNLMTMFSSTVVYQADGLINLNIGFLFFVAFLVLAILKKTFNILWIIILLEILFWIR